MFLFINTFGSFLHMKDGLISVNIGQSGEIKNFSPLKVESIFISTGASISTDIVQLCYENNIDLVFMDKFGNPISRLWHSKLGSTALIRKKQLEYSVGEKGLQYAKYFIKRKFENQLDFMEHLIKTRPNHAGVIGNMIQTLNDSIKKLDKIEGTIEERREDLLGLEGSTGRSYFRTISELLPEQYRFEERSRNPAKDEFNAVLNYHYGILYSIVEKACILAGVDPYVGIMHTDNYNKKSFVFDVMEMVRVYADHSALYLFSNRKLNKSMFEIHKEAVILNSDCKKVIVDYFIPYLDEKTRYRNRNISRKSAILLELRHIANEWLENEITLVDKIEIEEI